MGRGRRGSRPRRRRSIIAQCVALNACCPGDNDDCRFAFMGKTSVKNSILLVGASGRTGRYVLRYLCAASVPVIACVRSADRLASEPSLASAEVVCADVEQPHTLAPLIERAAHVIYLAGGDRRGLSPGAWQLEVDSLSGCLELARRTGLPGRWISVGYSGSVQRTGITWAEIRWRELKLAADDVIAASGINYFVLRTGLITPPASTDPRVRISQDSAAADAAIPCNALAFLLTGAALAGATNRSRVTVRVDPHGLELQSAVWAFSRLRQDGPVLSTTRLMRHA
jgi:NAD(P)-dependent dehydrogenase (short-subunit alcohol dehydrogenase family)